VQWLKSWNALGCAKVAVKINSEEEAREMERVAKENGVPVHISSLSHAPSFHPLSSARAHSLLGS
jgi:peptidyl-tRNA hydrolase